MNQPDKLQVSWDRVAELLRAALVPPPEKKKIRTPSAKARLFYELWRVAGLSQRKIAQRHQTSQSAVARACRAVHKWLGRADGQKLGELPAEEKYRALVRTHERKVLYAERKHLRDYRRSALPLTTTKTRVRKKPNEASGELERWEETVVKTQRRDGKCLDRYVKLSRDEVTMAARSLPQKPTCCKSRQASANQVSGNQPVAEEDDFGAWIDQLVEELQYLHQEYAERLAHHQRIYGYMDQYALKRDHAPSIPLGGWVKRRDFSSRRDQPGAFTTDGSVENKEFTAESVYGPPEQWQVATPEWFERKRREEASGQPTEVRMPPPLVPECGYGTAPPAGARGRESFPADDPSLPDGLAGNDSRPLPHSADSAVYSPADSADSSGLADSGQNSEKPRENGPESACWPPRASDSQTDSAGAALPTYDSAASWHDPPPPAPKKKLPEGMPSMQFEWYE
ncbi:MAG TPA: hypothetical protein VFB96_17360 [Pirellulaceae bacterium]|nr:hypothetical protein [Pirellulaceae bacterium]